MTLTTAASLDQLLVITQDLTALLRQETDAISMGKSETVKALTPRKAELSRAYENAIVAAQDGNAAKAEANTRQAVREATLAFQSEVRRNQDILMRQIQMGQKMIKQIGTEVERQKPKVHTYGNPVYAKSATSKLATTTLSLNQTV